ncbi:GNAT family N-acetyltransferase [Telmatospirillum sp.]|uniref:GNAT family N-acetyltransferase n=1 Tax=Telmatospirillum sp. TaxID=2079197 RepID=UPI002841EBEF|nr:GNAT family N-acetyltransferase [Telmatospirillum sp.]MDR3436808.1 GNAT family N-acetyltransferase [Telmatospirillum sp.]
MQSLFLNVMKAPHYPDLLTERLRITLADPSLAPLMAAFVSSNRDHLAPWSPPRPDDYYAVDYWRRRSLDLRSEYERGLSACFMMRLRNDSAPEIIGECNLTNIVRGPFQSCFLGYGLDRNMVGQGLMREAARAVIAFAFGGLRLHRIAASYLPTNERSGRVLRSLGFAVEGYARDYLFLDGAWRDHILASLINPTLVAPEILTPGKPPA